MAGIGDQRLREVREEFEKVCEVLATCDAIDKTFQISGDVQERTLSQEEHAQEEAAASAPMEIPDSDIQIVAAQTGADWNDAKAALIEAKGDLAAAIMKLT